MGGRPELGRNRPLSSADAGVVGPCSDPTVDGGATDEEDWGAWGGGGVEGADSGGFAGLATTNQAGIKVGLPERVPMGPAGGVWLGSAGTRLKADLVVCSGVGPLGSRRAASRGCAPGTIRESRSRSCLGQVLHSWPVDGCRVHQ